VSVDVQATPTPREQRRASRGVRAGRPGRNRSRALEVLKIVALLAGLGVLLPVLVSSHYGAMGIPRSDDWSYLLTLFRWVDSGTLSFNGWVSMTLVGQIAIAAPLAAIAGHSITTIQLFTATIGLVGLLGVVFIGRQTVRPAWWAVFVATTIAVGPLWGPLAPTFMTDVPTFTFEMLTLAAATVAFRRRSVSLRWFSVSIALGFVGVSIRQYAVIPVIAIVLVAVAMLVVDRDWRKLRVVLAIAALFAIASLAILAWWSGLPDSKSLSPTFPTPHLVSGMFIKDAGFLRLVGLLLLPVVILAGPVAIARRAWAASANLTTLLTSGMVLWLVATYWRVDDSPFLGNYVARHGVLSDDVLSGTRTDVIPRGIFDLLVVLASIAGILIVLAAVPFVTELPRRYRARELLDVGNPLVAVMGLTLAGFTVAYTVAILTGLPVYDRYALPLLPLVAFLVLHSSARELATTPIPKARRPRTVWAGVAIVLLGVLGLSYTADSASFDATRWKVAEMAVHKGYEPVQVGGGFEWLGWHRQYGPQFRWEGAKLNIAKLGFAVPCITVVINPPAETAQGDRVVAKAESDAISRDPVLVVARRNKQPCLTGKNHPGKPPK
jgi:hypothetical protein